MQSDVKLTNRVITLLYISEHIIMNYMLRISNQSYRTISGFI